MDLYIRIDNENKPVDHPIMENNFIQAFPKIDVLNLPRNFAKFKRVDKPSIGIYQVYEGIIYEWVDGVVKDVHQVRDMTEQEILSLQNQVKSGWEANGFTSWTFNEATCAFEPPIAYPSDENSYVWNEDLLQWV
jgi:hypothetical protein